MEQVFCGMQFKVLWRRFDKIHLKDNSFEYIKHENCASKGIVRRALSEIYSKVLQEEVPKAPSQIAGPSKASTAWEEEDEDFQIVYKKKSN